MSALPSRVMLRASRTALSGRAASSPFSTSAARLAAGGPLPGGTKGEAVRSDQALPIGAFYEAIMHNKAPLPDLKPEDPPSTSQNAPSNKKKAAPAAKSGNANKYESTNAHMKDKDRDTNTTASHAVETSPSSTTSSAAERIAKEESKLAQTKETKTDTETPKTTTTDSKEGRSGASTTAQPATAQEKARIIFGSRLAGPMERAERLRQIRDRSTMVAGVRVPPKPEEPDNCCMSGCVNCVWDRFQEEMEEHALASKQAEKALAKEKKNKKKEEEGGVVVAATAADSSSAAGAAGGGGAESSISMDDDGGGSESNWDVDSGATAPGSPKIAKDFWDEDLYKNIPVGIREFMKQEKKLKQKHSERGTMGG